MTDEPEHTEQAPPQEWLDVLAAGDEDLTAGRTVPWLVVRAKLLASIAEMKAERTRSTG